MVEIKFTNEQLRNCIEAVVYKHHIANIYYENLVVRNNKLYRKSFCLECRKTEYKEEMLIFTTAKKQLLDQKNYVKNLKFLIKKLCKIEKEELEKGAKK